MGPPDSLAPLDVVAVDAAFKELLEVPAEGALQAFDAGMGVDDLPKLVHRRDPPVKGRRDLLKASGT